MVLDLKAEVVVVLAVAFSSNTLLASATTLSLSRATTGAASTILTAEPKELYPRRTISRDRWVKTV